MFIIKGKTFQFNMSDCYKVITGVCPIETGNDSIECRCNELKRELIESNYVQKDNVPIIFHHKECGHYSCNDGQHRICIAGKMGKNIEIIDEGSAIIEKCVVCEGILNYTDCSSFLEKFD